MVKTLRIAKDPETEKGKKSDRGLCSIVIYLRSFFLTVAIRVVKKTAKRQLTEKVAFVTFAIFTQNLILHVPGPASKPLCTDPNGFDPHPTDCQK